jgi:hypothetical protein
VTGEEFMLHELYVSLLERRECLTSLLSCSDPWKKARGFRLMEGAVRNGGSGRGKNPCPCWGSKSNSSGQEPITISNDMKMKSNFKHLNIVWIEVTYFGVQWLGLSDQNSFWTIHCFVVTSRTIGRGLTHCEVPAQKIQRYSRISRISFTTSYW